MKTIPLEGCRPEPLMSYLKALGILRILGQQFPETRGGWNKGLFELSTNLDNKGLVHFFLQEYRPTPVTSPWNGGSGYYPKDPLEVLDTLRNTPISRFAQYREVLVKIPQILNKMGLVEKPGEEKTKLLQELRRSMPDSYLCWLDSAVVLLSDKSAFPPLLGTGGNDGRLDFSINFMKRLIGLGLHESTPRAEAEPFLKNALFGEPTPGLGKSAVGQFNPGKAGGPNSTQGMEGDACDNPWDFILMIEGVMLFTGTASRRLASQTTSVARFPFTVDTVAAEGSVESKDSREAKGELWLPLWSAKASIREVASLLNEGRAEVGERAARSGVDFARAIASLGVDRGIEAFSRMGFLIRNGLSVLVTPLGQFPVKAQADIDLLRELDSWLMSLRILSRDEKTPARFPSALRRIDSAILAFCRQGGAARLGDLLCALGEAYGALASSPKNREKFRGLPRLSSEWLRAADDGTAEFRLARSLAGLYDPNESNRIGPFAIHVLPMESEKFTLSWAKDTPLDCVWSAGKLENNLAMTLKRRLMAAQRLGSKRLPLASIFPAPLNDVLDFLDGKTDDRRLEGLLFGLLAVRSANVAESQQQENSESVPLAFSLIRPLFASQDWKFKGIDIPSVPQMSILAALLSGNVPQALKLSSQRLRHFGLTLLGSSRTGKHSPLEDAAGIDSLRLAASFLFPLDIGDLGKLLGRVVRNVREKEESI